ncbi:MAG TPA: GAF domain-containing protein [Desulfotignum sp.]|jgi:GAF domain-containing protein|nr:GAF domain-containing protein [Desulfotignum sp.]
MEQTERKASYFDLFVEVTKTITTSQNMDDIFALITGKLPEIMALDASTIRLLDVSGRKLVLRSASGLSDAYLNRGPIDHEEPVFKALKGRPIVIEDAASDPRVQYPDATRKEGICAILVVPIAIRGQITGILRVLSKKPRTFNQDEINFVAALGEQCGIAIENARIFADQLTQLTYFETIHAISKKINTTYELDEILDLIVTRLPAVMNLKAATIRLMEENKGKLELKAAHGLSRSYLERGPLDKELATFYLKQGEPVVILDAKKDIHTKYHKEAELEGISSILAVPVTFDDEVIGILRLLTETVRQFSHADINFALAIAEQSGIAIQRAIDYNRLKQRCKE